MKFKILVTGSSGLVGRQVIKDLEEKNLFVYSCYHDVKPEFGIPIQLDLTKFDQIVNHIEQIKPDIIIHLAAITNVDLCETEKDLAFLVNADATEILAKQAEKNEIFFVYVSTDYVFDGNIGLRKENDLPNPLGIYGQSKLAGENAVKNLKSKWCIARTSTPYGLHPTKKSFPIWIAKNLKERKKINVVTDQYTSPTYVPNLSKMVIEVATKKIEGFIHLAGATRLSRYELANLVAINLGLDKRLLCPVNIAEINWKAKRPKDSSLDVSKACSILNEKPLLINESFKHFIPEAKQVL